MFHIVNGVKDIKQIKSSLSKEQTYKFGYGAIDNFCYTIGTPM